MLHYFTDILLIGGLSFPPRLAFRMNTLGVRSVISICRKMKNLYAFVHISTGWSQGLFAVYLLSRLVSKFCGRALSSKANNCRPWWSKNRFRVQPAQWTLAVSLSLIKSNQSFRHDENRCRRSTGDLPGNVTRACVRWLEWGDLELKNFYRKSLLQTEVGR